PLFIWRNRDASSRRGAPRSGDRRQLRVGVRATLGRRAMRKRFKEHGNMKIAILPGDGIGPELARGAQKVPPAPVADGLPIETESAPIGGAGHDAAGQPLPDATLALAQ